ncbi:MAG: SpoIIE family protein phosphatase [Chloroflexota bacterium]|nr:SpoIIE family protein phosphatase [Chloroflexota bacterium]
MTIRIVNFWNTRARRRSEEEETIVVQPVERPRVPAPQVEITPNDPILLYFQNSTGAVDLETLKLDSPALQRMRAAGVRLVLPLVSQGELIGLVNLGDRLSEQDYSSDDRRLLGDLGTQAAPAVRVAQLALQQQIEARERERIQQELKVARLIQQTLLPKEIPQLGGWQMAAYYQPARAVGGDFYDFFTLSDGRQGIIIGDVTDKGVPAALVMATTRAILRGASQRFTSPGEVLERANDLLYPDIPAKMFVTCLCAILDPDTGRLSYANAGHDLPYRRTADGVEELRARGMPLGLMPGMSYEEKELVLEPGESVLFYSDGLVEAHAPDREMFGFPRLQTLMRHHPGGEALIEFLLGELGAFTGEEWEQEDDVTMVTLQREATSTRATSHNQEESRQVIVETMSQNKWDLLGTFSLPSEPGNERQAMSQVAEIIQSPKMSWSLPSGRLERLNTAVAEATMNAMEHGNKNRPEIPVEIEVLGSEEAVSVRITDQGGGKPIVAPGTPDIEAKLAGLQSPRGWGLFLIEKMVDEMHIITDDSHHTIELIMFHEGENHGD